MYVWFRLVKVLLRRKQPPGSPLGPTRVSFRVWPGDLDLNRHLNNGRYLAIMDLGRYDLALRVGLSRAMLRHGWYPVAGSAKLRFKRSLALFQRFDVVTRIVCWDDKWFFIEQRFERNGVVVAVGHIKAPFRSKAGNVPTARVIEATGHGQPSPPMPDEIRLWREADRTVAP